MGKKSIHNCSPYLNNLFKTNFFKGLNHFGKYKNYFKINVNFCYYSD